VGLSSRVFFFSPPPPPPPSFPLSTREDHNSSRSLAPNVPSVFASFRSAAADGRIIVIADFQGDPVGLLFPIPPPPTGAAAFVVFPPHDGNVLHGRVSGPPRGSGDTSKSGSDYGTKVDFFISLLPRTTPRLEGLNGRPGKGTPGTGRQPPSKPYFFSAGFYPPPAWSALADCPRWTGSNILRPISPSFWSVPPPFETMGLVDCYLGKSLAREVVVPFGPGPPGLFFFSPSFFFPHSSRPWL